MFKRGAMDHDSISGHDEIFGGLLSLYIFMMHKVLVAELLIVVLLLLVDVKIGTVEIKQTMRQFVASERPHDQLRIQLTKEAQRGQGTLQKSFGLSFCHFFVWVLAPIYHVFFQYLFIFIL